jgi:uncharacterized protein YjbI with pentapeptide repeats
VWVLSMKHLSILLAFLMTIGTQVSAADPTDLKKLKDTGVCIWCNLVSANLSDANLAGADLNNANVRGADLSNVYLEGANLDGTNLTGANLTGTAMKGITLCNTIMPDGSVIYSGC